MDNEQIPPIQIFPVTGNLNDGTGIIFYKPNVTGNVLSGCLQFKTFLF